MNWDEISLCQLCPSNLMHRSNGEGSESDTEVPERTIEYGLDFIRDSDIDPMLMDLTRQAARFHGHICPGLAMGIIASRIALEHGSRSMDEELVAVVENDACGVDAIQVLTGCTFGKGNLIFKDHGKSVYTFYFRGSGKAIRLSMKQDIFKARGSEKNELGEKVRDGTATVEETRKFWTLHLERTRNVLEMGSGIYDVKEVTEAPPEKAVVRASVLCDDCGEITMETRTEKVDGKVLCKPCAGLKD